MSGTFFCGNCKSFRIVNYRCDWDWKGGSLFRLNDDSEYLPDDPNDADEYDLEVSICLNCNSHDNMKSYKKETTE